MIFDTLLFESQSFRLPNTYNKQNCLLSVFLKVRKNNELCKWVLNILEILGRDAGFTITFAESNPCSQGKNGFHVTTQI